MNIYTLNVGQGQFIVVVGASEAFVVDTSIPLSPAKPIINVKGALSDILSGKNLIGLMITGYDADHFNEIGVRIVLNKYRPDWIMYPKYFKQTQSANAGFAAIEEFEKQTKFKRVSVLLSDDNSRFYTKLSNDFTFEIFSPHRDDMNSSNNCSLVCKIVERSTGASYLVTGDAESERWNNIVKIFGTSIKADVLDAPHHGSKNGVTQAAMNLIKPHTVLISAGVANSYGHPDSEALQIFGSVAIKTWQTNYGDGQSIRTEVTSNGVQSYLYKSP